MSSDAKRKQKAAEKRKQRELKVRREMTERRAAHQVATQSAKRPLKDLPLVECVISQGWEERGLAHILLARRISEGHVAVAGYYVDTLCVGLKDTAIIERVSDEEFQNNVKPNVFHDEVDLVPCDPGLARAVVEGAVDFAAAFGFKPNKRWSETRAFFGDVVAAPAPVFGRNGLPCYVDRGEGNARGVVARLERVAGPGKFLLEKGAGAAADG